MSERVHDKANASATRGISARAERAAHLPIGALMKRALAQPELVSLAAGFVDQQSLPVEAARSAAAASLAQLEPARAALQYGTTAGDATLRAQVLERVLAQDAAARQLPGPASAPGRARPELEHVVLTAGSNQLLYLLAETLLDPGDIVLCDAPTYFVFMGIVRTAGARAIGIASDAAGMRMDALRAELERLADVGELARVKAIYVMSYFDNPRSMSLSAARRPELCELAAAYAREHPIYVIEDAAYRELRYAGADEASVHSHDRAQCVVYAGTFSKSFSPGIRVGFGILPPQLVAPLLSLKDNLDFGSPHWNQRVVSEALRLGLYEPQVAELRARYAHKRDALLDALATHLPGAVRVTRPDGGLYVWAELTESIDTGPTGSLFDLALEEGVMYVPGAYFFPDAAAPRNLMRLSFGVQSGERIDLGIQRLARALARVAAS